MHGVSGAFGDDVTQQWAADQREVADQVQRFVTAAFIGEAQSFRVQHATAVEADGALEGGPADQSHVSHLVELMRETEGARRRDFLGIPLWRHLHIECLTSHHRMIEVNVAGEETTIGGKNCAALAVTFHRDRPPNAQIPPAPAVSTDASLTDHFNKRQSRAVENRHFEVIDFDERVVDSHAVKDAQQMLGSGNQHALAHQAGRVAHFGYMAPGGGDRKMLEIGPEEDDACRGWGWEDAKGNGNSGMKPDAARLYRVMNRRLVAQDLG